MTPEQEKHWLVRAGTIRKLWWIFGGILALTVLAQLAFDVKGYFGIDGVFAFGAVFLFAKGLGFLLKRPEDYYTGESGDD